jgi:hypothetical protein
MDLFSFLYEAAIQKNPFTKGATKKDYEVELQTWFGNARDRGEDGRKQKLGVPPSDRMPSINDDL